MSVTAVGGMVFGATNAFNPNTGYDLISRLLAIVILGGMGSIGGAMAAAVLLLVINDVVAVWWSPTWAPVIYFAALVVVLGWQLAHWTWVFVAPAPVALVARAPVSACRGQPCTSSTARGPRAA